MNKTRFFVSSAPINCVLMIISQKLWGFAGIRFGLLLFILHLIFLLVLSFFDLTNVSVFWIPLEWASVMKLSCVKLTAKVVCMAFFPCKVIFLLNCFILLASKWYLVTDLYYRSHRSWRFCISFTNTIIILASSCPPSWCVFIWILKGPMFTWLIDFVLCYSQ